MTGLTPSELREIGRKEGLSGRKLTDFMRFWKLRFGYKKYKDIGYAGEWAGRFARNYEWHAADDDSRAALIKANPSKYKNRKD